MPAQDSRTHLLHDKGGRFASATPATPLEVGMPWSGPAPDNPRPPAKTASKGVAYGVIDHLPAARCNRYEACRAAGGDNG